MKCLIAQDVVKMFIQTRTQKLVAITKNKKAVPVKNKMLAPVIIFFGGVCAHC
jgi:hypothetical protein